MSGGPRLQSEHGTRIDCPHCLGANDEADLPLTLRAAPLLCLPFELVGPGRASPQFTLG